MWLRNQIATLTCLALLASQAQVVIAEEGEVSPLEFFEQRIMPIFNSPKPSSCVQCHLASVDLKDYILPSHAQTFIALRDNGLIDLNAPEQSKILQLIAMGDRDTDKYAQRIHARTRKAEYEAFSAWILACCRDPELRDLPARDDVPVVGPQKPEPIIEFTRKSRLVDSFVRNVWSQRMRCFPCHTPAEIDPNNPKHAKPAATHADFVKQYGQRMNIFKETPEATVRHLVANSKAKPDRLPLLNLAEPTKSLLVLKPTSKVPRKMASGEFEKASHVEPVSHMGGLKMHVNDQSYKSVVAWIEDYAKAAGGEYLAIKELPLDNWYPTKHILRLKNAPESWAVLGSVQLFVHSWNKAANSFEEQPIAFTQALVTPRRMLNGSLFVLAPEEASSDADVTHTRWNPEGETLASGRYRIRVFYDSQGKLDQDPLAMLDAADYVGQLEVDTEWKEGFPNATVVDGTALQPADSQIPASSTSSQE